MKAKRKSKRVWSGEIMHLFWSVLFHTSDSCGLLALSACDCDVQGALGPTCNSSGACECKTNVMGLRCDHCIQDYWGLYLGNSYSVNELRNCRPVAWGWVSWVGHSSTDRAKPICQVKSTTNQRYKISLKTVQQLGKPVFFANNFSGGPWLAASMQKGPSESKVYMPPQLLIKLPYIYIKFLKMEMWHVQLL